MSAYAFPGWVALPAAAVDPWPADWPRPAPAARLRDWLGPGSGDVYLVPQRLWAVIAEAPGPAIRDAVRQAVAFVASVPGADLKETVALYQSARGAFPAALGASAP